MKIVAIVQARTGSTRMPNKVMHPIGGTPLIGLLLGRLSASARVDELLVATTDEAWDDALAEYVRHLDYGVYRGSETDVLDRYHRAAEISGADVVVRITADCPLTDPQLVDHVVERFLAAGVDYATNTLAPTYPDGLDIEVCTASALARAWREANTVAQREHVTLFLRESGVFTLLNVRGDADHSSERWTVDHPEDFEVIRQVFAHFHPRIDFGWLEVLALRETHPGYFAHNRHFIRNEALHPDVPPFST